MTQESRALTGLTSEQAAQLHKEGKGNLPPKSAGRSIGQILLKNVFTWFNILNFLLALALLWVKSYRNMLFMGVVVLNTLISTVQEVRAKKTVDKLTLLVAAPVPVMRDGHWTKLASQELVKGDLVRFSAGDQVCADAQVLSGQGSADEALLTGESGAVPKALDDLLYSGSVITEGRLYARLTLVGSESYAGQLVQSVRKEKVVKSKLVEDLKKLIRFISIFLLPIGLVLFYKQYWQLGDPLEAAIPATVAAVFGMIPEGLVLLTSMALAVGVIRLGEKDTLVQELYGIENLARVDVLCVDKTGTVTRGRLQVEDVIPLDNVGMENIDISMRRMLQASEDDNLTFQALRSHWSGPILASEPVALRIPFSSARKWSAVAFSAYGTAIIGAPEFIMKEKMPIPLADQIAGYADQGFRVMLLAHSPAFPQDSALPEDVLPQALILINDLIREDFADTAQYLAREGITIKVISGDNPRTVAEVARRAGLEGAENWTDASFWMDDGELAQAAVQYTVFGRVAPDQKRKLVLALKASGHTVAMVGDGVNDVPALKVCDCAIAMAGGSDAAQKTSQVMLLAGNFSAIPQVILEG
ncbi:MAG: HAD-IC family P-type ATPase, partial [Eubacteriales bacterium]|nr:HAD-IC family P-type ATPase [Eubacteriales bacterium]